jgi:hypothetical protein
MTETISTVTSRNGGHDAGATLPPARLSFDGGQPNLPARPQFVHSARGIGAARFSYAGVPAGVAHELKAHAERIRAGLARHTAQAVQIGNELRAAKRKLPHGAFLSWAECELGISPRAAQLYMRMSAWMADKDERFARLPVSTLYLLAAPTTPTAVAQEFVQRIESNAPMSYKAVHARIKAARCADPVRRGKSAAPSPSPGADLDEPLIVTDKDAVRRAVAEALALLRRSLPSKDFERIRTLMLDPNVRATPCCLGRKLLAALATG